MINTILTVLGALGAREAVAHLIAARIKRRELLDAQVPEVEKLRVTDRQTLTRELWERLELLELRIEDERKDCTTRLEALAKRLDDAEERAEASEKRAIAAIARAEAAEKRADSLRLELAELRRNLR